MKSVYLPMTLALCVSAAGAEPTVYDFNGLTPNVAVYGQNDGTVSWDSVNKTWMGYVSVKTGSPGNLYIRTGGTAGEQLISSLTSPPGSLFHLNSSDTKIRLTWTGQVNQYAGFMVGIWMDGIDAFPNTATTNEWEHVVQFGVDYSNRTFRVRGVNGLNARRGDTGIPTSATPVPTLFTLDVDITGNGGDGSLSLTTKNLSTDVESQDPNLQNAPMSLTQPSPNGIAFKDDPNYDYDNPSKWTGWYIRNGRAFEGDDPNYTVGDHTLDNLTLEVIPEPLGLLTIGCGGALALPSRRRGSRG